jgi:hypothetical protein
MHCNVLQTAVVTAVIRRSLRLSRTKNMWTENDDERQNKEGMSTQYGHTFESLTKAWTYSSAAFPLGK